MDSWDEDEFEVPSVTQQASVAVNWDDEEEEEEEVAPTPAAASQDAANKGPLKPKQIKKLKMKELEEKRALEIALTKARLAEQANETEAERKAREKRSIEEADFEAAIDAFSAKPDPVPAGTSDVDAAIAGMRLVSLADHESFGDAVATRLVPSNSKYALEAIKVMLTKASLNLTADDMKELTTIINVIKNEKIAQAKPKGKKKKVTGKQGYANVERSTGGGAGAAGGSTKALIDQDEYGYDEYDDFM